MSSRMKCLGCFRSCSQTERSGEMFYMEQSRSECENRNAERGRERIMGVVVLNDVFLSFPDEFNSRTTLCEEREDQWPS